MAKDIYHQIVKESLVKDGWTIINDPIELKVLEVRLEIDLGAEKFFSATKGNKKIAVEVKSFAEQSNIYAFHQALGQYLNYRLGLEAQQSDYQLYLAIPIDIYLEFFQLSFVKEIVKLHELNLIVFHPIDKSIQIWETNP